MKKSKKKIQKKQKALKKIIGAQAVIESLLEEGVECMFGYPGGANMPIYDELYKFKGQLKHILTRHEQGAIHAAQGYARATGKVGVCSATSGPGSTNLLTGLADAQIDSTPLVCITGQVASHLLGSDAFQETDIISISMPITKWNYQITKVEEIPWVLAKAFYIANSGRPGPVLIDITKDVQFGELDFRYKKCEKIRSYKPTPTINLSKVEAAANLINKAKKPLIIFGQGVVLAGAEQELISFIEKANIPTASTLLGLSALPTQHRLNVGMVGMHGNYAPNVLTNECDVLIAIGMRFDDRVTADLNSYAKQAKIIHFDIDAAEVDKNVATDIAVLGDAKETLSLLFPLINKTEHLTWLHKFKDLYRKEFEEVTQKEMSVSTKEITMTEVIDALNKETKGDAILVPDVGQNQMIACRYGTLNSKRSFITSGGLGTMGFSLPAAIGAKMGKPNREVIAIMGDGGFQMNMQELGTILQTKTAVKIIILNNDYLGLVRQWQEMFFEERYASTKMLNPDFVKIAEGYGIESVSVDNRTDLPKEIAKLVSSKKAFLLEVKVQKKSSVFPMIPSGESVANIRLK